MKVRLGKILKGIIKQGEANKALSSAIKGRNVTSTAIKNSAANLTPAKKELVLFIMNRHPKDIMRSFSHEMIHHMQNLQGRLGNHYGTNTNEDDDLVEIEKEAYLLGNITFRNWEDKIKNEYKDK